MEASVAECKEALIRAMDKAGITDNTERAAIAAVVNGECGFQPRYEASYAHTSNDRIRMIFGSRVADLSDEELDEAKADPEQWFELVYGSQTKVGRMLGNTEPGDGYKYRGCGFFQLTGRGNFERYGKLSGHPEIVEHPELANDPQIAADIAVAYMQDRYRGGGWAGYKRAVGNSIGEPDRVKNASFIAYMQSGEFNAK